MCDTDHSVVTAINTFLILSSIWLIFPIGTKQSGEELGDVGLPPWAKNDCREFIRVHREVIAIVLSCFPGFLSLSKLISTFT